MFTLIPTRKAIITAAIALFGAVTAFAQTGSLAGLVTDESTKKPIEGVTIGVQNRFQSQITGRRFVQHRWHRPRNVQRHFLQRPNGGCIGKS